MADDDDLVDDELISESECATHYPCIHDFNTIRGDLLFHVADDQVVHFVNNTVSMVVGALLLHPASNLTKAYAINVTDGSLNNLHRLQQHVNDLISPRKALINVGSNPVYESKQRDSLFNSIASKPDPTMPSPYALLRISYLAYKWRKYELQQNPRMAQVSYVNSYIVIRSTVNLPRCTHRRSFRLTWART